MYYYIDSLTSESETSKEKAKIIKKYESLKRASPYIKILGYDKGIKITKLIKKITTIEFIKILPKKKSSLKYKRILNKKFRYLFKLLNPLSPEFNERFLLALQSTEDESLLSDIITNVYFDDEFWDDLKRMEILSDSVTLEMTSNTDVICRNCGGETYVATIQTRSCDEGVTNFYTCLKCHKKWKY